MKEKRKLNYQRGFTLTELLVVIVIVGILASLTLPRFLNVTTKAKSTEAKLMLKHLYNLQKAYYLENDVFAKTLAELGFEQEPLKTEGGEARYKIELVEVNEAGYRAIATSVIDFDKDGTFNVWSINENNDIRQEVMD
ncbi:MAG: prepilin-type N-terminal cleavage/methylation domain-containing protein [bacterium]